MTISPHRLLTCLLALAALVAAGALLATAPAHAANETRTCDISDVADRLGPTSVTSLKVTHASCATGKRVVRAFQSCRLANGASGRCVRLVLGFACQELRTGSTPQFTARVTCRKRRATVVHRYTQVV